MRYGRFTAAAVLSAMATACGGGGGGRNPQPQDPVADVLAAPLGAEVACETLSASSVSAVPGTAVTLSGLPAALGEAGIRVLAEDEAGSVTVAPLYLSEQSEGEARFAVPLHPLTPADGGSVALEIGDGLIHCPALAFEIQALPQAPADYAETVSAVLSDWVDAQMRAVGLNPAVVRDSDPESLDQNVLPYWLGAKFADGDDAEAFATVAAEAAGDGDLLFERILMASGVVAELQAQIDAADALSPTEIEPSASKRVWVKHTAKHTAKLSCESFQVNPRQLKITSADELSARMKAAANSTSRSVLGTLGTLLGNGEVANVGGSGGAFGKGNALVFVANTVNEARLASEPQTLGQLTLDGEQLLVEDRPSSSPARWSAKITASGREFNLAKATASGIIQGLGLVPGPVGTAVTNASFAFSGQINAELDRVTQDTCFKVLAAKYGPVDITDERWTESKVEGSTLKLVEHDTYEGIDIGGSEIRVDVKSGEFASAIKLFKTLPVQVNQQIISLLPSTAVVSPGDTIEISATVANSQADPALFVAETLGGRGTIVDRRIEGDFFTVTVETPAELERFPVLVRFTSQGKTLPAGTPKRQADAEITTDPKVTISPNSACLLPGNDLQLEATLEGFPANQQGVSWSVSAGSLSDSSSTTPVYTAPNSAQSVTIQAQSTADPSVEDEITVNVANGCLRKIWYPAATISVPGNGVYGGGGACPDGEQDDDQTEELVFADGDFYEPPAVPPESALWTNRSQRLAATLAHSSTRYQDDNDVCRTLSLTADNASEVVYSGELDGTMRVTAEVDLRTECAEFPDGQLECAAPATAFGYGGYIYTDIREQTSLRLVGELSCANISGMLYEASPINIIMLRYEEGQTPYDFPDQNTSIRNPDGSMRSPVLAQVSCNGTDRTVAIDVPFVLDAPRGTEDLIVFSIVGSTLVGFDPFVVPDTGRSTANIDLFFRIEPN